MTDQGVSTPQAVAVLEKLFGPRERTVVLVIDKQSRLIDYRVDDLNNVLATLSLNGFGQLLESQETT